MDGQVIGKVSEALKRVNKPALVSSALMNMFTQVSPYNYEVLGFILECLDGAAEDGRGEEELVRRASQRKQRSRFRFTLIFWLGLGLVHQNTNISILININQFLVVISGCEACLNI